MTYHDDLRLTVDTYEFEEVKTNETQLPAVLDDETCIF